MTIISVKNYSGANVSDVFQMCFMNVSGVFQGCFSCVSRMFLECFRSVSETIQGFPLSVLQVFRDCFRKVSSICLKCSLPEMFQEYSWSVPAVFPGVFRSGSYGCRATVAGFFKISARVRARDGYLRAPPWSKLDRIWMVFRDAGT